MLATSSLLASEAMVGATDGDFDMIILIDVFTIHLETN